MTKTISAVLIITFSSIVNADVFKLKALVDKAEYEKAYQYAQSVLDEHEGIPSFDLQYAIAAIDSGRISEGVFALERVRLLEPSDYLVKLELARGYYLLDRYELAEALFNEVASVNPPQNVRNRINLYLRLIEKKTTVPPMDLGGFIELFAGYDSNINSGPEDQLVKVVLDNDALGQDDPFNQLRVGFDLEYPVTAERAWLFSGTADLILYETEEQQNTSLYSLSFGHRWQDSDQTYSLKINYQNYHLDDRHYRDLLGLQATWGTALDRSSFLYAFASVNKLRYPTRAWKDSMLYSLGGNYLVEGDGAWNPVYFMSVFAGVENADASSNIVAQSEADRQIYGLNLGAKYSPRSDLVFLPSLTYQSSHYSGVHWLYNVKRQDDYAALKFDINWELTESVKLLIDYSYSYNSSNIELYDYERQQVLLGMQYGF